MLGPLLPGHGRLFFSLFLYSFKVVVRAFEWETLTFLPTWSPRHNMCNTMQIYPSRSYR